MIGRRIFAIGLGFLSLTSSIIFILSLMVDTSLINVDYIMMIIFLASSFIGLFVYSIQRVENKIALNIGMYGVYYTIAIVTGFISSIFSLFLFASSNLAIENSFNIIFFFVDLFTLIFMVLIIGIFYFNEITEQFISFFKKFLFFIVLILLYYIFITILSVIFSILAQIWSTLVGLNNDVVANQDLIDDILAVGFWENLFFIINIVLVAPIVEEFFFRYVLIEGVLIRIFKIDSDKKLRILKMVLIVIISSCIFAAAHAFAASNLLYFIKDMLVYLPAAIIFSVVYLVHRNIFLNIGLHMFNNLLVTALFYLYT